MKRASKAVLCSLLISCAAALARAEDPAPSDDNDAAIARDFAASVERSNALDPYSPNALNARLAFADFLAKRHSDECQTPLDAAQLQLDLITANPALPFLPTGLARAADVGYQIHLGRASCNADAAAQERELRAALESAKRAAELYRDGFDAVAMATMQFNVSLTYHSLGDTSAALATLQATIDIDREYGFADDAEDNYQLLLEWNKQASGPEAVEARMQDFPERSTQLTFAWSEGDAAVTLQTDTTQLFNGETVRIQNSRSAKREVRQGFGSWKVSYEPGESSIDLGQQLPTKEVSTQQTANSLAYMLTNLHDFVLARNGDYDDSKGGSKFAGRVRAEAKQLNSRLVSMGTDSAPLIRRLGPTIQTMLWPDTGGPRIAEDYNLETGTWIGASLDQGVWYPMTASLSLPLSPGVFVAHKMEFAYTRPVACTPDSPALSCIEIVLRAAPDPTVIQSVLDRLARVEHLPQTQRPQLWSATEMRLVTDPKSLQPYRLEMRRHLYRWSGKQGPDESLIQTSSTTESFAPAQAQKKERT
jgi:tetratricopeptide (TPR) repeat protein